MGLGSNESRKLQHINIVLKESVEGPLPTMLNCVYIPHKALTDLSPDDVNIETELFGKVVKAPIIISGMTGGAPGTERINRELALIAEEYGIAMGVGSQRAAIENPSMRYTFKVVREAAPTAPIIANIGAAEIVRYPPSKVLEAVEMVDADALAVHLNLAQEAVQPEGSTSLRGFKRCLERLLMESPVPVIIKEVGCGLSLETVRELWDLGVTYFDVEGAGGTNWITVEKYRAGDRVRELVAENLMEWGIPTAASIVEVRNAAPNSFIVGSGGIRTAVDVVRAIVLGADAAGMALPFLKAYFRGMLRDFTQALLKSLKVAVLLSGVTDIEGLKRVKPVILPPLSNWVRCRGLKVGHLLT